jgi:hypothetical protein
MTKRFSSFMRRAQFVIISILALTAALAVILAVLQYRSLQEFRANEWAARAATVALDAQFMADPRFRNVRVPGYTGKAGLLRPEGVFRVTGSVSSSKDWSDLRGIIGAVNPPGRLLLTVNVLQPKPVAPQPKPARPARQRAN